MVDMSYRVEIYHTLGAGSKHFWNYRLMGAGQRPIAQSTAQYETEASCKTAVAAFFRAVRMAEAAHA